MNYRQRRSALGQCLVTNLGDRMDLSRPSRPCSEPPQVGSPPSDVGNSGGLIGVDQGPIVARNVLDRPKAVVALREFISDGIWIVEHVVQFLEDVISVARINVTVDSATHGFTSGYTTIYGREP